MIVIQDSFLTNFELNYLLNLWDSKKTHFSGQGIHFYSNDLLKNEVDLSCIHNGAFSRVSFKKIRLQKYNNSFKQIKEFHGHEDIHNYILFLNDNFEGGELIFEKGISIIPTAGTLVYFNNNENHRVLDCIGDRYTLIFSGNEAVDLNLKEKNKSII